MPGSSQGDVKAYTGKSVRSILYIDEIDSAPLGTDYRTYSDLDFFLFYPDGMSGICAFTASVLF